MATQILRWGPGRDVKGGDLASTPFPIPFSPLHSPGPCLPAPGDTTPSVVHVSRLAGLFFTAALTVGITPFCVN